jgi:hypothetical protein
VLPPGRKSPSGSKVVGKINILMEKTYIMRSTNSKSEKATQLQAWTGTKDSRRLWLPDFKTIGTRRW